MAFSNKTLGKISGGGKKGVIPALFSYSTADALATVNTSGYFNDAFGILSVNDIVIVTSGVGGTLATALCVVVSNTGGVVDLSDGTVISRTDTD